MTNLPTTDQVRSLPTYLDQTVAPESIDENGHMNIGVYFRDATWAPWLRLGELGMGERYIPERNLSFFTVEHRVRYLGEMRLGDRYSVHVGFAERSAKAVHGISFVLDHGRDRVACALEEVYVHVSMETRRAVAMPEDVAATLDGEIAAHPWVREVATGLALQGTRL